MSTKRLIVGLLLPLVAVSPAANAGSLVADRNHTSHAAKPGAHRTISSQQSNFRSAFASNPTQVGGNGRGWNYRYPGSPRYRPMQSNN